jgi:hypothetical protein
MEHAEIEPILRDLFAAQRYAVLGTQGAERVSLNLMAVAATDDLRFVILATERATPSMATYGGSRGSPCWWTTAPIRASTRRRPRPSPWMAWPRR